MLSLESFANQHNLRTRQDSCGEPLVILGKPARPRPEDCSHIYEHGDGKLGLVLLYDRELLWNNAKKRLLGAGFELHQNGDTEGVLLFDPENAVQVRMALKRAGIHPRPNIAPELRARLVQNALKAAAARLAIRKANEQHAG